MDPNAPAFPTPAGRDQIVVYGPGSGEEYEKTVQISATGLTIRAEFAKCIMSGMAANPAWDEKSWEVTAQHAVEAADALIAELNKKETA